MLQFACQQWPVSGCLWKVVFALAVFTALPGISFAQKSAKSTEITAADRLFTLEVLPLLKDKCFGCHGADPADVRGDYNLLSKQGMLKGGESEEPSLVPGKPRESSLYQAVMWEGYEMPPKENDRLTKQETESIRKWIAAGAPWPNEETQKKIQRDDWAVVENQDGVIVNTSGGLADEWTYRRYQPEDIWAFQPIANPKQAGIGRGNENPIDHFVNARISDAGLAASRQADPRTLIRRVTYDLTGLPPTPSEIDQFQADWKQDSKAAWNTLVERLIDSKRFGERQAQHWLDVVRYADTGGFSNDYERSQRVEVSRLRDSIFQRRQTV